MANLTGSVTMATASILNNSGLDVSYVLLKNIASIRGTDYGAKSQNVHQRATAITTNPVTDSLNQLSTNGAKVVKQIGASILPGLVSSVPTQFESNLSTGELYGKIITQSNTMFGNGDLAGFFTNFASVQGYANISKTFMDSAVSGNTKVIGDIPGSPATDYSGWITNGYSETVKVPGNLSVLGEDLADLGDFGLIGIDVIDHFGRSTGLAYQLNETGMILIGDLDVKLENAGLDLSNLLQDFYEPILDNIFRSFTNTRYLEQIAAGLDMTITGAKSLLDFLDIKIALPRSQNLVAFESFTGLASHLKAIGNQDGVENLGTLGTILVDMNTASDLPLVNALKNVVNTSSVNTLITYYGNGTGPSGNVTLVDMMGSAANYIHEDTFPNIENALTVIGNSGNSDANDVTDGLDNLIAAMNGQFENLGTITVPAGPGAGIYADLDSATAAIVSDTNTAITGVKNAASLANEVSILENDYILSATQLNREFNLLAQSEVSINVFTPGDKNILSFAAQTIEASAETLDVYGEPGNYFKRVATNDLDGEIILTVMREALNIKALSQYGVPIVEN